MKTFIAADMLHRQLLHGSKGEYYGKTENPDRR